ncbi:MAG: hypothetical protein JWP91_1425 [Fibrobacteres bacterium]|nr:hypothetical protein [Fibrobacterota bacterium]
MKVPATLPAAPVRTATLAETATATAAAPAAQSSHAPAAARERAQGAASPSGLGSLPETEAQASARRQALKDSISAPRPIESGLNLANPETVNHHNSIQLMKVCQEAYDKPNYSIGHTNYLYKQYADHQIITYSGSKEMKDWGHDANIAKGRYREMGTVHRGFSSAYDELKPLQDSMLDKNKPVVVAGHSLGGATATIAALDLKQRGYNVVSLTTFGCPRVGAADFKKTYDAANIPTFRYVNSYDVVPRIPKIGYNHVGTPFYLGSDGKMLDRQESILKLWPWNVPEQRVSSHHLYNYISNLGKFVS